MGSHHRHVAILVPDDKLDCYVSSDFFAFDKNSQDFYPGPVLPPRTDGSPLWKIVLIKKYYHLKKFYDRLQVEIFWDPPKGEFTKYNLLIDHLDGSNFGRNTSGDAPGWGAEWIEASVNPVALEASPSKEKRYS